MNKVFFCILLLIVSQFGGTFATHKLGEKKIGKSIRIFGSLTSIVLFIVFALVSSIYTTTDQEIGFVNQLGVNTPITTSGIKFKTPFISKAYVYPGTTQSMTIGYTEEREDSEDFTPNSAESSMITSDFNFIEVDAYMEYQIVDPIAYHYATADPIGILRNAALTAIKNNVGLTNVDTVMTTGRAQLEAEITEYPYPVPMTLTATSTEGETITIASFMHKGGKVTIPYAAANGSRFTLSAPGKEITQ